MWGEALSTHKHKETHFTALWLCVGEGSERGQCYCLASRGLSGTCPISSHFPHFPYVTGILPAVSLVVNPRVGGLMYILSACGCFKLTPENPAVSSTAPTPTGFYSQKLWGFIFLAREPWAVWSGLGLGSLAPKVSLPIFIHHM